MSKIITIIGVLATVGFFMTMFYLAYLIYANEKVVLIKDEWQCTEEIQQRKLVYISKTLIPTTEMICVNYRKR